MTHFARTLIRWARKGNLRQFPWRETRSPYRLLFTELMLRRTRAENVVPVYNDFFRIWPELSDLLEAEDEDITRVLYPLGLTWRIRNILAIRDALRQGFPNSSYAALVALPGVGDYVASAVLCFAYDQPTALIDTNLVRLLTRHYGLVVVPETRRRKQFVTLARDLVPQTDFVEYNYATLDLPATICRPEKPRCSSCPLLRTCLSAQENFLQS